MVGIAGVVGPDPHLPAELAEWTTWGDEETTVTVEADRFALQLTGHDLLLGDQPATGAGPDGSEVRLWVWGDVYGHGEGADYEPRPGPPDGSAAYCASLYERLGMAFVDHLNGDYAVLVHDGAAGTLAFVTDRLASHPIYTATPTEDVLVFASNLQALPAHPGVEPALDRELLVEYFQLRRVFGVETPLVGVRELQPGAVTTVDLADASTATTSYWEPRYAPEDRPFEAFVEELGETLRTVLSEWTDDDLDYGLLLSGGSDSRLVGAAIDQDVVAYHNADWLSREARVARRVAEAAGHQFRLLERFDDHEARSLESTPRLARFSGWFDQAYFTEFEDVITDEVDVLVSGLFADILFAGGPLATHSISLGPIGTLSVPLRDPVRDLEDYVAAKHEDVRPLPYYRPGRSLGAVLRDNLAWTDHGVESHGVEYASLADLVMYGDYYPLGADTEGIFSRSLMQLRPYRTPYLDKRLIDLHQRIPRRYFIRRNLVNATVANTAPDLARIPHARSGVPLDRSFPVEFVGRNLHGLHRKYVGEAPTPKPHFDHKPWPDRRELLRATPFALDAIRENEARIRSLPFLDYEGAQQTYWRHLDGEDNHTVLYSLLTFLEMPLTGRLADRAAESPSPEDGDASRADPSAGPRRRGIVDPPAPATEGDRS